jgi:hypothetical protein
MWTDTTRAHHARSGLALPSDLTRIIHEGDDFERVPAELNVAT